MKDVLKRGEGAPREERPGTAWPMALKGSLQELSGDQGSYLLRLVRVHVSFACSPSPIGEAPIGDRVMGVLCDS